VPNILQLLIRSQSLSPPQWNRTAVQEMIAHIYDERDDAHAAVWTYRQFRAMADVATTPTAEAVDFVAYQCLKMGHADTAIAVLALNVIDNPCSARTHFGLGRAFEAADRRESAAKEYRAALSIDPTFTPARMALNALH
jgi:hypothetical protein